MFEEDRKNLPMIVDISISDDGRQIYQVHETNTPVRMEMPGAGDAKIEVKDEKDIGKRSFEEVAGYEDATNKQMKYDSSPVNKRFEDETEVWGPEVEAAFEEALKIIPKNGLSKIKVSGRSCGRNELISDYILQETGKLRTRKQVSSHIQVIKNLKKNPDIITLINNGPSDPNSLKKFEEVFSKITFQKSIGEATQLMNINKKANRRRFSYTPKSVSDIALQGFEMNYMNCPLSNLKSKEFDTPLKLKSDANISSRFPGLFELVSSNTIPSLHGMCKLNLPMIFNQEKNISNYNTNIDLELKNLSVNESSWSCLTVIYSFGQEVVRLTDAIEVTNLQVVNGVKNIDFKVKFATEFWDAFFASLEKANVGNMYDDKQKDVSIRAITIKQIIFKDNFSVDTTQGPANILKKDIRSILLWEFLRVNDPAKALTTVRRIHLPTAQSPGACSPPLTPYQLQVAYTPSTTPQAVNTPHPNFCSLQQQEDLISRLESPIELENSLKTGANHYPQPVPSMNYSQFESPNFVTSNEMGLEFTGLENSFNPLVNSNGPVPKRMHMEPSILQQFDNFCSTIPANSYANTAGSAVSFNSDFSMNQPSNTQNMSDITFPDFGLDNLKQTFKSENPEGLLW